MGSLRVSSKTTTPIGLVKSTNCGVVVLLSREKSRTVTTTLNGFQSTVSRKNMEAEVFGDNRRTYELIEELLDLFSLEEIFDINDLTTEEVLRILLEGGHLGEPSYVLTKYE